MLTSLRRKVRGDLKANWGQFLAVWLVVTLGTAFYGAMYPSGVNMLKSIYRTYDQLRYLDFQVQLDSADPAVVEAVRAVPGVAHAEGRLIVESGLQLAADQRYPITLRLISVPDGGEPSVNRSDITNGRAIQADGEVLLLKSFADFHDIHPGDTLRVWVNGELFPLTVAGLAFNAEYFVSGRSSTSPFPTPSSFGVAWARYGALAAMSGRAGTINDVVVHLEGKSGQRRDALQDSVRVALEGIFADYEGASILSRKQTPSGGVVAANINGVFPLMRFYSGMFLGGATIITSVLLARLVEADRRRIGTMRALGVTRRELTLHYVTFGAIIGVTGGLVGSLLGYLNSFWVMQTFISYLAGGTIPGFVNTPQVPFLLLGLAIVATGTTIAGAYPAWAQSATPPGIALRPATPKTPNALSRARLGFLPGPLRWAIRNLLRAPGRTLGTAVGVIAGAMMLFSALAMWDTLNDNFGTYFEAAAYDLRVDMNTVGDGAALADQIRAVAGVEAVQSALVGPVSVTRADGDTTTTVAITLDESDPFLDLTRVAGAAPLSSADGVWIGNNLERALGVGVGDTLTLAVPGLGEPRTVPVRGVVSYAMGSPIFVPHSLLASWLPAGLSPANTAFVRVAPGQAESVRETLADLPGMRAIDVAAHFEGDVNHYLEYFRVGTIIFGSFGYILTLAVLYNTVSGSLRERRDELSILRALGATQPEIALTVTIELMMMVALGAVAGVPLGREIGFWLSRAYQTEYFGQINVMHLPSYLAGLASLVIVVLAAEIPGLRAAQRADLGQVSKQQSI